MKKQIIVIAFLLSSQTLFSMDVVYQCYLPSLFGYSSGNGSGLQQMQEVVTDQFQLPIEVRFDIARFGLMTLSYGFASSAYLENGVFGSFNISTGIGFYFHRESPFSLSGLNVFLYPIYDFPVYPFTSTYYTDWKSAIDLAYAIALDPLPVYINLYFRNFFWWKNFSMGYTLDFGISVGLFVTDF